MQELISSRAMAKFPQDSTEEAEDALCVALRESEAAQVQM